MNSHTHSAYIVKPTFFRQLLTVLVQPFLAIWHVLTMLSKLQNRERTRLQSELSQTRGLMQLLMKQRNGYRWTVEDRRIIRMHLKTIWGISPYLVLLVAPGGLVALPILAWWLDRRRQQRLDAVKIK